MIIQATGPHDGSHTLQQLAVVMFYLCSAFLLALLFLQLATYMTAGGGWSHIDSGQGTLYLVARPQMISAIPVFRHQQYMPYLTFTDHWQGQGV
jgi:hypothetical protein